LATLIAVLLALFSFMSFRYPLAATCGLSRQLSQRSPRQPKPASLRAACQFANPRNQCENPNMQNLLSKMKSPTLLSASIVLFSAALAAQTTSTPPASSASQQTPAAKTPAAGTAPHTATAAKTAAPLALTTQKDKTSYAIGMNIGKSVAAKFRSDSLDINNAIFLRGMKDAMAGGKTLLTDDQAKAVLDVLQADMGKNQEAKMAIAGDVNKAKGDAFLAANKAKDGVVTLPSGLQYKIITPGTGPKPTPADSVVCNYRGTLIDGTEFDASSKHGGPATFPVGQVIKGWTEALQLMPVGSKWQLYIPSDLAYGSRGAGGDIGPNSTLIFDIELLSIKGK
jgi:FKBP-type peptidyl-prolyl cis-trans isomerase FklB